MSKKKDTEESRLEIVPSLRSLELHQIFSPERIFPFLDNSVDFPGIVKR